MSREILIGMTLMLTFAVLGAGQEAPNSRTAEAAEPPAQATAAPEPVVNYSEDDTHRLTLRSPAGKLELVGASAENELSLTARFEDNI